MDKLIEKLKVNAKLFSSIQDCEKEITPILQRFITNFPDYTDHSFIHSKTVLGYTEYLLANEYKKLNEDEIYILIMACFLHDIGMCPTIKMKKEIKASCDFKESRQKFEDFLRDVHHEVSYRYIITHWKKLHIVNEVYAEAIGLVAMGHRIVELLDFTRYNPEFPVKSGTDYICLPYLTSILRLADELDITNDRTPELLFSEYLPKKIISKKEWEKHKANYFVTFNKVTIKIKSKCYNKDLYFALLKQYSKIESAIKYSQKIVKMIPENGRGLKIDFLKLEKDIQTVGFIPKEIGFSFDLQNTINTFIGDNLYKNKFVAIRECLQNSIDTSRYKKQLSKSQYQPVIKIKLHDKQLIIEDNGLGMDDFIVENYFSRLAKSYYTENRISEDFEAISQFGIGVFSYFLLCDYFEVESKQEGKPPIKFRATKDSENYFHFYDNPTKTTTGTTITFFLSNEISFDELLDQIRHYIRFVEFPLEITYKERVEILVSESFEINKSEILGKRIQRDYLEALQNLETVEAKISNDDCEGILGLLISKDKEGTYIPIHNYDTLHTYSTSVIELSQKGIFVGITQDRRVKNILGKINLKRKYDIDLGRYHIKSTEKINELYEIFYKNIFDQLFENWRLKDSEIKYNICRDFIGYYLESIDPFENKFFEQYFNNLYFKAFINKQIEFLNLTQIIDLDEFLLVRKESPFDDYSKKLVHFEEIYNYFNKPLILETWSPPASFLLNTFKIRKSNITIRCTPKHWFFNIRPKELDQYENFKKIMQPKYEGYMFDQQHICAHTNISLETPFNLNHEILKYYISNKEKINKEQRLFNYFDEFFYAMHRFIYDFHMDFHKMKDPTSEIMYLNSFLSKINQVQDTDFILSKNDFPTWINHHIKW
jgi:molecular chaperone HtpG